MRHIFIFSSFLILAACSHLNFSPDASKAQADNFKSNDTKRSSGLAVNPIKNTSPQEKTSSVGVSKPLVADDRAQEAVHYASLSSSATLDLPRRSDIKHEDDTTRQAQDSFELLTPNTRDKQSISHPRTPSPFIALDSDHPTHLSIETASNVGGGSGIDTTSPESFDIKSLLPKSKPSSDYSDYGFITPTDDLEKQVNSELRELRVDQQEASDLADLVIRLKNDFQLDLEIDNKRLRAQLNWYVKNPNYLDRTFKRSSRYLHYIAGEVKKRDLPMELALLPFVESAYDPFAYSHGRASGLWQFIPGTGKIYGLHQNWWYDGRRDVIASTKAALDYLTYLNKRFDGNWLHALAAYNSGSGRVGSAIKRNKKKGKPIDFWSLKLPKETKAYVPKLLAMAKIVLSPEKYGITLPTIPDKPYFAIVKTGSQIDLAQAARLAKVDINEIYKLNPGFNQWASAPLGPHRLLIPIEKASGFTKELKALPAKQRLSWNRYSVKRGDSLIRIAKKFNTTPKLIKQVNNLKSNMIREKQKLLIPMASEGQRYYDLSQLNRLESKQSNLKGSSGSTKLNYTVKKGDTIWDLSREHNVGVRSIAKWNGMAPKDPIKPGQKLLIWSRKDIEEIALTKSPLIQERKMIKRIGYRVRKGDSLARIASKFGVRVNDLLSWNKLNRKKYLQPGQKLTIYVDLSNG